MMPPGTPLGAVQVTLGGLTMGEVHESGCHVHLAQLTGWWDPPASTGQTTQRPADHGAWVGPAYYGPRIVGVLARIDGTSPAEAMRVARLLINTVPLDLLDEFSVTDEQETLSANVRQSGDPLLSRSGNRVTVSLSLVAPDPRRYSALASAVTGLQGPAAGGLVLPLVLPLIVGSASGGSGYLTAVNEGDVDSSPMFIVTGPCPPFTITDPATGRSLAFAESVPAGRFLEINTANRTALLDGVASRVVTGSWPVLHPGSNTFLFQATSYDAGALLTIAYQSARS